MFVHSPTEVLSSALGCPLSGGGAIGVGQVAPPNPVECDDLLERFRLVGDGRSDIGRAHPVAVVLALAAAAVVGGMRSFTAIAGWVADTPPGLLRQLYARCGQVSAVPSKTTIWRALTGADPAVLDAAVGGWLASRAGLDPPISAQPPGSPDEDDGGDVPRAVLAVDGKRVRGAVDGDGNAPHLLAAATHGQALRCGGKIETGENSVRGRLFEGVCGGYRGGTCGGGGSTTTITLPAGLPSSTSRTAAAASVSG